MGAFLKDIKKLNKIVYNQLNEILKTIDKKLNLKFYAIVLDDNDNCDEILRVKKTLSLNNNETEIIQDNLNELQYLFNELGINTIFKETEIKTKFKEYCNKREFATQNNNSLMSNESQENNILNSAEDITKSSTYVNENSSKILYINNFTINVNSKIGAIYYLIEIRNADTETIDLFYKIPVLSFLRMVMDYYFLDYYVENPDNTLNFDTGNKLIEKYNEDSIQFTRRMTRLYFGKLQELLQEVSDLNEIETQSYNELNNQYYVNNMLEKIEDISNHFYEGSSPFGSILFFNNRVLKSEIYPVDYTLKFQSNDLIALTDSKMIRKLLELTNNEKDLYLISDHETIYGLGKVKWSQLKDSILFKIEFRGLSKYNVHLITTDESESSSGDIVFEGGKKFYKTSRDLEITEKKLLQLSFKSPILGEEGYTGEKFKRLLKSNYFGENLKINEDVVEYLEQVVMNAREQKHGTMVVITDYETAISELKTLKKQSILIESVKIVPEYIQYLTSIDGAIYFDTNGKCHAIGVILDGIAKENIGDSSRGARYNSAYRYLEKLKESKKSCVIVIISEDGMVNLIPETDSEEKIYALFQQWLDLINEETENTEDEINEIEQLLMNNDNIDYHLYFKVAEEYRSKEKYEEAIKYYEKGLDIAGRNIIVVKNYRYLANLYFDYARKINTHKVDFYQKAKTMFEKYIVNSNENELNHHDYNNSAITYKALMDREKSGDLKIPLYENALYNYNKAIEMNEKEDLEPSAILFSNRASLFYNMKKYKEALEDLIEAEYISSTEDYINRVMNIIEKEDELVDYCIQLIQNKNQDSSSFSNLIKKLEEYKNKIEESNPEVAASLDNFMHQVYSQ